MKIKLIIFGITGLLSGVLSARLFGSEIKDPYPIIFGLSHKLSEFIYAYSPGWIFGLFMVLAIFIVYKKKYYTYPLFIVLSTFAFYFAMLFFKTIQGEYLGGYFTVLNICGLAGSIALAISIYILYKPKLSSLIPIIIVGTITPSILFWGPFPVFIFWQLGVSVAINYALSKTMP